MAEPSEIPFDQLASADLTRGAVLLAGPGGGIGGEPISKALTVGNQGGIRAAGPATGPNYIALFSKLDHADWPDEIDRASGVLTYHGDNREPSLGPLDVKGNQALHTIFRRGLESEKDRAVCPPLFVFTKANEPGVPSRSVVFEGVAVPGAVTSPVEDWFVSKWYRGTEGRYENYLLTATILDVSVVPRAWIDDLDAGERGGRHCPPAYRHWMETGQRRSAGSVG